MSLRQRLGEEIVSRVSAQLEIDSALIRVDWVEGVPHVRVPTRLRFLNEERMDRVLGIVREVMGSEMPTTHDMTNEEYGSSISAVLKRLRGGRA